MLEKFKRIPKMEYAFSVPAERNGKNGTEKPETP